MTTARDKLSQWAVNLKEAYQWLEKAIDLAGKKDVRQMALDDPDLEPLWLDIAQIKY